MVSADSLHVDILVDIFSLLSPSDLASASLVSKSFNGPAIRQLYHDIHFRAFDLRRWPTVMSPFSTILTRQELAVYVRSCEITAIPPFRHRLHSEFLRTCTESLSICPNIHTFTFMIQHPALLRILRERKQLYKLQLQFETINPSDAEGLAQITGLHTLALHRAPLNVCLQLSRWASNVSQTLRILIIHNTQYLTEDLLIDMAKHVSPQLRSFHINNCSSIPFGYVLRAATHLPLLESLGFSIGMSISNLNLDFPKLNLPNLHHLILNIHPDFSNYKPNLSFLLELFFDSISDSSIFSITCKFSNPITFPDQAMLRIIRHFRITLSKLNLVRADMSREVLADLTGSCKNLYQLAITPLRTGDVFGPLIRTLALSSSLHTLIMLSERDHAITQNNISSLTSSWAASDIREVFRCIPSIQKVITQNRCWTRERAPVLNSILPDGEDLFVKVTPTRLAL